jgi:internalin A
MDLRDKIRLVNITVTDEVKEQLLNMPNLTFLSLKTVTFDSLAFLRDAARLTTLEVDFDGLDIGSHATGIGELRQLKMLIAGDSNETLSDLSILKPLQNLEELRFTASSGGYGDWDISSKILDVSPLEHLPKLHTLKIRIRGDRLDGFALLKQLRRLSLRLSGYSIDITPLGELVQLEELELSTEIKRFERGSYTIGSISPLAALTNLTSLAVRDVRLRSIEPVKNMKRLQHLDCSENIFSSLKPLMKLTELRELNIAGNPIKDYSPIRGLPNYDSSWEPARESEE